MKRPHLPTRREADPFLPPGPLDRPLLAGEAAVLQWVVAQQPQLVRSVIESQRPDVQATSGRPTELGLASTAGEPADVPDGPLEVGALVVDEAGSPAGLINVWVTAGRISSMEYSWFDGPMPRAYPDVRLLRPVTQGVWSVTDGQAVRLEDLGPGRRIDAGG